jgi:hypothetical protein
MERALKGRQNLLSPFQGFTLLIRGRGLALLTPGYCLLPFRGRDQFHLHNVFSE